MKTKLTRILGVAMTVALLVGLFVTAAPLSAGTQSWSKFGIPSITGMVLDTGNATGPMVMGSDGTVWAGRGTGNTGTLIKSTDFGATWSTITTLTTGATNIMAIVVSSIDPLQVYVTDGVDIYKTADGGTTWVTLSALTTGGALITSIDVGYIGANAYIFAGTSGFGGADGSVWVAQEAVFGMPWSDMLVGTDRSANIGDGGSDTDVTTVIVDPVNFATSQMVMAVVTDQSTGTTIITTKYSGAQWGATVDDAEIIAAQGDTLYSSSVWLPDDFSSSLASGTMQLFVGVASMTDSQGDVFWVVFGSPSSAVFDLNIAGSGTGFGVSSLDGIGPGSSAQMLASGYADGGSVPIVMASSVGGAVWTANTKAPTGSTSPLAGTSKALSQVLIDPVTGNAIVATHGVNSAVSASSDWAVWNGVSLINTTITSINDLFVNDDFVAMVTDDGSIDSLWTTATGSGVWQRVLDSTISGFVNSGVFDMYEFAGGAGFLANDGGTAIYRTLNGGATWTALVSASPVAITAWQVVDANTILIGDANQVRQTTNGGVIWFTRAATALGTVVDFDFDSATGDILAASATTVAVSSDNGATWTVNSETTTNIAAATFGASYATTGEYFITGTAGTFKSSGSTFKKIDTGGRSADGNGIVSGPGVVDMVYSVDDFAAAGVVRHKSNRDFGEVLAGPTDATFTGLWLSAGSNVLWTIDTFPALDLIYTYTDTLAVAGTDVTATATGTTTATITWTALTNATKYTVVVDTVAQTNFYTAPGSATNVWQSLLLAATTASIPVNTLTAGTQYYVSVWADTPVSSFLFGGAATSFTTNLGPPATPTSLAPAAGAANVPVMPTFQWNPPSGATPTGYLLEVSTVSDFATTILSVALPAAETYYAWQGDALDFGTVYYWRVTASGVSSSVPVSSVFTTEAEPVDPVDVITPTTPNITLTVPAAETPAYIWAIIAVGFVLTVAVIILIVRTRRVV